MAMITNNHGDEESSIEDDLELPDQLTTNYDFSAWESFRKSLSIEKRASVAQSLKNAQIVPLRCSNNVSSPAKGEQIVSPEPSTNSDDVVVTNVPPKHRCRNVTFSLQSSFGDEDIASDPSLNEDLVDTNVSTKGLSDCPRRLSVEEQDGIEKWRAKGRRRLSNDSTDLTDEERYEIEKWRTRFKVGSVFNTDYEPKQWEQNEMIEIAEFLSLVNPKDDPNHLGEPGQESTKLAIKSIFFPERIEPNSILLKRGPILVGGEDERELMLFTNGFVLSCIELDTLVDWLFDGNGSAETLTQEQLCERFSIIDTDGSGSLDRHKLNDMFKDMGIKLSQGTLDDLMNKFDTDHDGSIDVEGFKSMLESMKEPEQPQQRGRLTWGTIIGANIKKALGKKSVTRKLDVAFRMSDIDRIEHIDFAQGDTFDQHCAKLTFALYLKGVESPLTMTCSKPCYVQAWMEAFRTCIKSRIMLDNKWEEDDSSIEDDLELLDSLNTNYDFSAWESFNKSLPAEKRASVAQSLKNAQMVQSHETTQDTEAFDEGLRDEEVWSDQSIENKDVVASNKTERETITSSSTDLTEEERYDIDKWRMRFKVGSVFHKNYVPKPWEKREMKEIISFLALENPNDHPAYLDESDKESTKQAISSIFFPEQPTDLDSILLKRGPILVGGQDERELMLFTNGFVLSRIELDTLVELLFDVNSSAEELTSDQLCERFRLIDTDGSGSLDRYELHALFRDVGMMLSEDTLDNLMDKFDSNHDGSVDLNEFKFMLEGMKEPAQPQEGVRSSWTSKPAKGPVKKGRKKRLTLGDMASNFVKALQSDKTSVTRKLDVAFRMTDIDRIENIGVCHGDLFDQECAKLTFALYLKGVENPLVMTCSKRGHVGAWMEAFRTCIKSLKSQRPSERTFRNSNPFTHSHVGLITGLPELPKEKRSEPQSEQSKRGYSTLSSRIDWGDDDDDEV